MAYPDDLLSEGEEVLVHRHPHWKMLVLPVLAFVVFAGGGLYLATMVSDMPWHSAARIAIVIVVVVLIVWLTLTPFIRWRTTHFIVTTDRVMAREGVLKRTGIDIPLFRINSVVFEHGIIDRLFGCGTLKIESASDDPLEFDDIPHVEQVHSVLYREVADAQYDEFDRGHQQRLEGESS